jgi:hypothetical protein
MSQLLQQDVWLYDNLSKSIVIGTRKWKLVLHFEAAVLSRSIHLFRIHSGMKCPVAAIGGDGHHTADKGCSSNLGVDRRAKQELLQCAYLPVLIH